MQKLKRAFPRPQISAGEAKICVDDANQGEVGEMPALGYNR
jgi:hypothetical protein